MSHENTDDHIYSYQDTPPPVAYECDGISLTKQEFKDECDINLIVPQAESTGIINHKSKTPPTYGDFTTAIGYQEAMNRIIDADASFQELPAKIRDRMKNDPGLLLDFLADPNNEEEAIALGLVQKAPKTNPKSPDVPPSPPASESVSEAPATPSAPE